MREISNLKKRGLYGFYSYDAKKLFIKQTSCFGKRLCLYENKLKKK